MRDRISISKQKINELFQKRELELELKDIEYEYYLILVSTISLISRDRSIFKRNIDLYKFIKKVFKVEYREYVQKNKSILIGRTINYISTEIESYEYEKYANILIREINELISPRKENYNKFLQEVKK